MPTYREYLRDNSNACYMAPPIDLQKWERVLGEQYVLLIRAHYLVAREMNISENDFVKDVSKYPQLSDLYVIADVFISDYSSAFVDFSILGRPEFCFAYDYDEYCTKRGFYIDLAKELPCTLDADEDILLENITEMDYSEMCKKTCGFKGKYAPVAGNATSRVINEMIARYL